MTNIPGKTKRPAKSTRKQKRIPNLMCPAMTNPLDLYTFTVYYGKNLVK